ncbi:MAG: hypothetical protein P8Z49_09575 [Acidobacteriota bacterium]|jgi:hypothetical protein
MNVRSGLLAGTVLAVAAILLAMIQHTPLAFTPAWLGHFLDGLAMGCSLAVLVGWLFSALGGGRRSPGSKS